MKLRLNMSAMLGVGPCGVRVKMRRSMRGELALKNEELLEELTLRESAFKEERLRESSPSYGSYHRSGMLIYSPSLKETSDSRRLSRVVGGSSAIGGGGGRFVESDCLTAAGASYFFFWPRLILVGALAGEGSFLARGLRILPFSLGSCFIRFVLPIFSAALCLMLAFLISGGSSCMTSSFCARSACTAPSFSDRLLSLRSSWLC